MSHTLGPWKVGSSSPNGGMRVQYAGPDHTWHIADVYGQCASDEPLATRHGYRIANARLIASSPSMLKALKGVLHHNDAVKDKWKLPGSLIRHIEQAIAEGTA